MNGELEGLATVVDAAARSHCAIEQLSIRRDLSVADAYAIQHAAIQRRIDRGEMPVGVKLGFTSREKALQMGVHDVILGHLTDAMRLADGGRLELAAYIHPRIEPEIAFLLNRPLRGQLSEIEALAAVAAVAPALEVIDSRYRDFKFALSDVIADNSSAAAFVIGPWMPPPLDLSDLAMAMEFDGQVVRAGVSSAILGHPLKALAAAARIADGLGETLEEGWIVMAGAATAAEPLRPGLTVRNVVSQLGSVSIRVGGAA